MLRVSAGNDTKFIFLMYERKDKYFVNKHH
jgi:hypothetical protein